MGRRVKDVESTVKNWHSQMQSAGQAYKDGIDAVQENPLTKAAEATEAYLSGCQRGNDKRIAKLNGYGMDNWKRASKDKGAPRLGTGATASQPIYRQAMAKLLPHIQSVKDSLPQRGTFEQNLQRFDAFARGMHAFKDSYGK